MGGNVGACTKNVADFEEPFNVAVMVPDPAAKAVMGNETDNSPIGMVTLPGTDRLDG